MVKKGSTSYHAMDVLSESQGIAFQNSFPVDGTELDQNSSGDIDSISPSSFLELPNSYQSCHQNRMLQFQQQSKSFCWPKCSRLLDRILDWMRGDLPNLLGQLWVAFAIVVTCRCPDEQRPRTRRALNLPKCKIPAGRLRKQKSQLDAVPALPLYSILFCCQ